MSDASNNALQALNSGDPIKALDLAIDAVDQSPNDWHCHYAVGICLRQLKKYFDACKAYEAALRIDSQQPSVLLALSITRQLNNQLEESVIAAKRAIDLDPDYYPAFNTLGMTRKIQGKFEMASLNYEAGAEALCRYIVKRFVNHKDNPQLSQGGTRYNLWMSYALKSATFVAINSGIERVYFPNEELFEKYDTNQQIDGYFWQDIDDQEDKKSRLFLPNFFNTLFVMMKREPAFRNFLGNRSIVLRALGKDEAAEKHFYEAEELNKS